jgi:hypothetical protein
MRVCAQQIWMIAKSSSSLHTLIIIAIKVKSLRKKQPRFLLKQQARGTAVRAKHHHHHHNMLLQIKLVRVAAICVEKKWLIAKLLLPSEPSHTRSRSQKTAEEAPSRNY